MTCLINMVYYTLSSVVTLHDQINTDLQHSMPTLHVYLFVSIEDNFIRHVLFPAGLSV